MNPIQLLSFRDRTIYLIHESNEFPASFLINDHKAGGIVINLPSYDKSLAEKILHITSVNYIFFPSHRGAIDTPQWKCAFHAKTICLPEEAPLIDDDIDIEIERKNRLTRTIDFLPLSGATPGTCGLRLKNKPGIIFFGPALEIGENQWPTIQLSQDDHSSENRMFGALGLSHLTYDYAFTDTFHLNQTQYGPNASTFINQSLKKDLGL